MRIFASDVEWRLDSRRYMCPPYGVQTNLGTHVSPRGADSGTERGHCGATRRVRISPACSQTLDVDMARVSFTGQLDNGECETPTLGSLCPLREGNVSRSLALLGVLILAACLCVCARSKGLIYAALPALVLVVLWTVCLPFAKSGLYGLVGASPTLVHLAYSSLSSFQLSELKEVYGMSEARICSLDKLMYGSGLSSAGAIHSLSWFIDPLMNGRLPFSSALFAVAVFLVFSGFWATTMLVCSRKEGEIRRRLGQARQEPIEVACGLVAKEFRLSARGRETLNYLCNGHTRSYIADKLGVQDGTAKTYISRVYQKLNIHSKDELISFIRLYVEAPEN